MRGGPASSLLPQWVQWGSRGELLLTKNGQQRELLIGLASWRGRKNQQCLALVLAEQRLAVEFDRADGRVHKYLVVFEPRGNVVSCPHLGELGAELL